MLRRFHSQQLQHIPPKLLNAWPFQNEKPHSYYYERIYPQFKKSKKPTVFYVKTAAVSPVAIESFKTAIFEACLAFSRNDLATLKYMLEPNLFNHISPLIEYLKKDEIQHAISLNNAKAPQIKIPALMKYEIILGLNRDRTQNASEKDYFRLNLMSAFGYRRYLYVKKKTLSVGLNRILRVDALVNTSFSLTLDESGDKTKKETQNNGYRVWTFETLYKYKNTPFIYPENHKFDQNLLSSSGLFDESVPNVESIKNSPVYAKLSRKSKKALLKSAPPPPQVSLRKVYLDEKEKLEKMRPTLSVNGWKIADIDYALNGNPLFAN